MKRNRILLLVVLSLLWVLGLAGAAGASAAEVPSLTFNLALGQSRYFPAADLTLRFLAVTEDTRCALCVTPVPGYVAIQVGVSYVDEINPAVIDFRLVEGGPAPVVRLANGYRLALLEVLPSPDGSTDEARRQYEAKFRLDGPLPSPDGAGLVAGASAAGGSPDAPATFTLALGETHYSPAAATTILFEAVIEDTRSGGQETLVPAGAVTVRLKVTYDYIRLIQSIDLRLVDGGPAPTAALANGYGLKLHWVSPNPDDGSAAGAVPSPHYEATFSLAAPVPGLAPDLNRSIVGAR